MAGYADTKKLIEDTLVGRPAGTMIYPEGHQAIDMSLLDYIHSVELLGASELQGIATTSTVPVQPDNAKVSYIATVPSGQTYVFTNFHDQNGNSISITTGANTVSLLTFLWNGEYWQVQNSQIQLMLNITAGYLYAGIAIPTTNPGSPDEPVFYIAAQAGTYTNFDSIVVNDGEAAILKYVNSSWVKEVSGLATREEVSRLGQEIYANYFENGVIEDAKRVQALYLNGLTNGADYYYRVYVGSNYKQVQISNNVVFSAETIVASGLIENDNLAILSPWNNSGIYGFVKIDNGDKILQTSDGLKLNNDGVRKITAYNLEIPYFLENKTHNDTLIKEAYVVGLDSAKDYYFKIYKGVSVYAQISETVNGSEVVVSSATLNSADGFNKFEQVNNSGITGVFYCDPDDYSNFVTDNVRTKIKKYEISTLGLTNAIANNSQYDPALNYNTRLFIGSSEYDSIVEELYLEGADKTKKYTFRFYRGSNLNMQVWDGNSVVANGVTRNRFVRLEQFNNSGINGYAFLYNISVSSIQTGNNVELNYNAFSSLYLSTNIAKFIGAPLPYIMDAGNGNLDFVEELFLVGLAKDGLYRIRTYVGSSLTYLQVFGENSFLASGVIANPGEIIKIDEQNNSGISGYAKISSSVNVSTITTTDEKYINNVLASQLRFNPAIMLYLNLQGIGRNIVVDKNGVEDVLAGKYTSFAKAILDNYGIWNLHIAVEEGEYDLLSELEAYYGTPNFRTLTPGGRGIELGYNITIEGCPNAVIKADYVGSDENMQKLFSPLNISPENPGSVTLIGVNIKCSRVRYAIHDDKGSSVGMYTNIYDNCNFYIDNTDNDYWHATLCIGGGLGKSGNIIIRNSIFESIDPALPPYAGPSVSYHNSYLADAKSQISIVNNYIKGLRGFRFGWYGSSTKMTEIILAGNSVGRATIFEAERTDESDIINMELHEWNTIINNP